MPSSKEAFENLAKELSAASPAAGDAQRAPSASAASDPGERQPSTAETRRADGARTPPSPGDVASLQAGAARGASGESPREKPAREAVEELSDLRRVNPRLVCLLEPRSEHAESYYRLRYVLETRRRPGSALVVGVTSPGPGDGKTLTGTNLAGALAQDARSRVLLLDLDLRRKGAGLSDYLAMKSGQELGVVDWIQETGYGHEQFTHYLHRFNLHVMAAGSDPELPYELLKSSRLDDLIRLARKEYDFVIIDTPQILRLPDTELISRLVDGFLIVVRADRTGQGMLEEALNLMTEDKVLGLVFNAVDA